MGVFDEIHSNKDPQAIRINDMGEKDITAGYLRDILYGFDSERLDKIANDVQIAGVQNAIRKEARYRKKYPGKEWGKL
jgi:hypothetical protein